MVANTPYTEEDYKYGKYYLLIEGQYMYNYIIACTYSILLFGSLVLLVGICFFSCGSTNGVYGISETLKNVSGQNKKEMDDFYAKFGNPHADPESGQPNF